MKEGDVGGVFPKKESNRELAVRGIAIGVVQSAQNNLLSLSLNERREGVPTRERGGGFLKWTPWAPRPYPLIVERGFSILLLLLRVVGRQELWTCISWNAYPSTSVFGLQWYLMLGEKYPYAISNSLRFAIQGRKIAA